MFNLSATLNVGRLAYNPSLCLPHLVIPTFEEFPVPLIIRNHHIKAIVFDKDNCIAKDHDDKLWPQYSTVWDKVKQEYPLENLLIVSNSAGTNDDLDHSQAVAVEQDTGVAVLRHSTKKPGCYPEILDHFARRSILANEIAIVGDRLFTDMLMANMMGSWGVWIREGVEVSNKMFPRFERDLYERLVAGKSNPFVAPTPKT
ncbi:uncharacterized protein KQ657_005083 [Scheffersomyces spartinae]|uniref:Uncharacterized protein n=1 Tax=Scheffersomyces spartinae TaxID=45513 RepID=A0A9P7V9W8_9ASCO|nr:uncharacterized protein KQ657_005083 [Scheffersomyces spartinae]KAG7193885.1 hypothetical protein KQ657_005083 [Scheffersomyces spartinae]